jgi:hypothetical protein
MRHYATVDGGGDNPLPATSGYILKTTASDNLRKLRIESGLDYVGFEIGGRHLDYAPDLALADIRRQLDAHAGVLDKTRVVVACDPIADVALEEGFDLFLSVQFGEGYEWKPGGANSAGTVVIDPAHRLQKISAILLDIFQDVMIANSPSIASVIENYCASGKSMKDFYALKAEFAREAVSAGVGTLFGRYEPTQYAAFSALARRDFYQSMTPDELTVLARCWIEFLNAKLAAWFLSAEQAARLVRSEAFRTTTAARVNGAGPRTNERTRRGYLRERDLLALFRDRQVVHEAGSYVLCIVNRPNGPGIDRMSAIFGRAPGGVIRRLKLCSGREYDKMKDFVREGWVTPVRLFLQEAPRGVRP